MKINNTSNATFGHKIILDIGASNPKGTLKAVVRSDDGRDLYKIQGSLNNSTDGFDCYDDYNKVKDEGQGYFINRVHRVIKTAYDVAMALASDGKIQFADENDKKLSGIAVFVPGTTFTRRKDDKIAFIPNLRNTKGNSLQNIDFKTYEKEIKENKGRGKDFNITDDFELIVTKDLGGAGLGIAKKMAQKNMLKAGDYIMGVMTGGGFGSVDIKVKGTEKDPVVEFETSESSSYLTGNVTLYDKFWDMMTSRKALHNIVELLDDSEKFRDDFPVLGKLGRQGVSVKSHINSFLKELKLDVSEEEFKQLTNVTLKVGDARIVDEGFIHINKSDKLLYDELKRCRFYKEVKSSKKDKAKFVLDTKVIKPADIKRARIHAVNDYANSVSLIAINKINDCLNKVVLVGPFAQGLNEHIKENSEEYDAKDLPDLIKQKILINTDPKHADLPSTRRLMKLYNFEIICDPEINIANNTDAGDILLDKNLEFTPQRGSWFSIPLDNIKQYCKEN